jgi:UDP-2,3-diacylglucosamine hydrolase
MIFGHRHFPLRKSLPNSKAEMINLGDWLHSNTYLKISEAGADLLVWKN